MKISLFKNIKQVSKPPKLIRIIDILNDILDGTFESQISKVRSGDADEKNNLPVVVFSGEMTTAIDKETSQGKKYVSYRDDKSLTNHSGYCVIDLDHVQKLKEVKKKLMDIDEIFCIFTSPSGDGLKVIYRIPPDISKHRGHYRSILHDLEKLGLQSVDTTSINESRLCFVSYDPDIYINEFAEEYISYIEELEEEIIVPKPTNKTVLTDYEKLKIGASMIDGCADGYKHHTLIRASYLMGGYIASGKVREEDAVSMLKERILNRNIDDKKQAFKTISDGIAKGKSKPIYEIEEIENEFKTHISKEKFKDEERGFSFLADVDDVDRRMMRYIEEGAKEGFGTGSDILDTYFVFKENTFNVLLGHDNVGKSFIIWFLAVVASALHDWKWIMFSPENKIHRIKKQLIDFVLGQDSKMVNKVMFAVAKKFVDEHFIFIRKDEEYTIFDLLEHGQIICSEYDNVKGFIIDPYNSLALDYKNRGKGLSAYEYHLKCATNMRIFSEKFCSIYLNGHSVTSARRKMLDADGSLIRPRKDDMEQGGLWANRADDFLIIHRKVKSEEEWMFTEIHVDKIKDVETGGRVTFEDPVKFRLMYGCDFIDDSGDSPLKEWRSEFFHGEQTAMELPKVSQEDAF